MHSKYQRFTQPSEAVDKRANEMIAKLSLEEKIELLGGATDKDESDGNTKKNDNGGIPGLRMADGPVGVHWWCDTSTAYPALICATATWDRELVYRMGWGLGRDARARGVHILLAPGVNIYRSPLCGRNFEYCGEDPYLAAQTAIAYIKGVQDMGVSATVKHYAVNYQEFDRHNVSSDVDERTLHEVYLPAFKAAVVEAGTGCVMTAYNLVNGVHCSEHDYLNNTILKGEWGFDGLVMSDWVSTYSAAGAANGGLDLEMPTAKWMNNEKLLPAVKSGEVGEEMIDDKIRRLLRLAICFGWLDNEQKDESIPMDDPETSRVALDIARSGMVLLKNDNRFLPFDKTALKKLAVLGPTADPAVVCGGGSAYTPPNHQTSILEGIRNLAGEGVEVVHAVGPRPNRGFHACETCAWQSASGQPGLDAEYYNTHDMSVEPAVTQVDARTHFRWGAGKPLEGIDPAAFAIRWSGSLTPREDGEHVFYAHGGDGEYRAWLGDELIIDTWDKETNGQITTTRALEAGVAYPVRIEYRKIRHWSQFHFGYESLANITREQNEALQTAEGADAVIACVGFDKHTEGEGHDRSFGLPAGQDEFIRQLAGKNENLAVVLLSGGNVDMTPWIDKAKALLQAWYPGQEGGTAIAEILFGEVNPSGKLPATFEAKLEDRSSFDNYRDDDGDKRVTITDGVFTGYRHHDTTGIAPRFPFGFGLSYTTFAYENLQLSAGSISEDDTLTVSFDVVNTGDRPGAEIAQLYVGDRESTLPRPAKELKGFAKVELQPGQRKSVQIAIDRSALVYYAPQKHDWVWEPGEFDVLVGASAGDIRLRSSFSAT